MAGIDPAVEPPGEVVGHPVGVFVPERLVIGLAAIRAAVPVEGARAGAGADGVAEAGAGADVAAEDEDGAGAAVAARLIRETVPSLVDLDLPPVVTQHDELAVPVAVYNYLKTPQRISVALTETEGFTALAEKTQSIDLAAGEVGVRYFRLRADKVGPRSITIDARGASVADRIRRSVEVFPDGIEAVSAFQNRLDGDGTRFVHPLVTP